MLAKANTARVNYHLMLDQVSSTRQKSRFKKWSRICACAVSFYFHLVWRPHHRWSFPRCRLQKRWTRLTWRTTLSHTPLRWSPDPCETCWSFPPMTSRWCTPLENVGRWCRRCLKRGRRWHLAPGNSLLWIRASTRLKPGIFVCECLGRVNANRSGSMDVQEMVSMPVISKVFVFILFTVRWTLMWGTAYEVTRRIGPSWTESEFPCGICQLDFIFKFFAGWLAGVRRLENYLPGYWFHVPWLLVAQLSWTAALCLAEMMLCVLKIRSQTSKPLGAFLKIRPF